MSVTKNGLVGRMLEERLFCFLYVLPRNPHVFQQSLQLYDARALGDCEDCLDLRKLSFESIEPIFDLHSEPHRSLMGN